MKESLFQFAYYPIFLAINTIKNELKKEKKLKIVFILLAAGKRSILFSTNLSSLRYRFSQLFVYQKKKTQNLYFY